MRKKLRFTLTTSFIVLLFGISSFTFASDSRDSVSIGKECKIVLYNGIEARGEVTSKNADTICILTDEGTVKIARKEIKYVLKPNEYVSNREGLEGLFGEKSDDGVPDASAECDVYLINGIILKDVNLALAGDSSLYAYKELAKREIPYSDITRIVFKPSAPFWKGYLAGASFGFLAGFIPLAFSKGGGHPDFSGPGAGLIVGLIFSVPAGLIGGAVGVLAAYDDVYNFRAGVTRSKIKRIKYIILKHPI